MNIFVNCIFSLFMATGASLSTPEATLPLEQENALHLKDEKSFNYVAGSSGVYPVPTVLLGHRIKKLGHTDDFAIGVSYSEGFRGSSERAWVQGYAHYGYYKDWDSNGAYYGPGTGIALVSDFNKYTRSSFGPLSIWCKPSFTVGKEHDTFFHEVHLCVGVPVTTDVVWAPVVIPMLSYEIGVKF